ncbi:hypothetical protein QFZ97_002219 [Paraburkholderia youngii]
MSHGSGGLLFGAVLLGDQAVKLGLGVPQRMGLHRPAARRCSASVVVQPCRRNRLTWDGYPGLGTALGRRGPPLISSTSPMRGLTACRAGPASNRSSHARSAPGESASGSMPSDINRSGYCEPSRGIPCCTAENSAPCSGQTELHPVNIVCTAETLPHRTSRRSRLWPPSSTTQVSGMRSGGFTAPLPPCAYMSRDATATMLAEIP